jgi:hypothetical protein
VRPKQVPFLADENLDQSNFENFRMSKFLEACELDIDDIRHYRQPPPEVLANFFQTWLFFGVLCCFFEEPVQLRDFIKVDARSPTIYSSNLPRYLHKWKASMRALPREARERTINRKKALLSAAAYDTDVLARHPCQDIIPHLDILAFSSRVLITSLGLACWELCYDTGQPPLKEGFCVPVRGYWPALVNPSKKVIPPSTDMFVRCCLRDLEWCPYDIERFTPLFSAPTAYYLACLPRYNRDRDARNPCSSNNCTSSRCATNHIDTENYTTQHADGCFHFQCTAEVCMSRGDDCCDLVGPACLQEHAENHRKGSHSVTEACG